MVAYSVTLQTKPRYYELINRKSKRVEFRNYTEQQAIDLVRVFPHLAFRPQLDPVKAA
jgi:hypothetical protein